MESLPRLPWDFSSIVRGWYDDSAPLQLCVVGVGPVALSEALSGVSLLQAMPRVDLVDIGASLLWDAKASLQAVESPLEVARPKPLSLLAERIEPSVKRRPFVVVALMSTHMTLLRLKAVGRSRRFQFSAPFKGPSLCARVFQADPKPPGKCELQVS
ncbi:unnamed protein product [Effrenium voratum]|nr:unnamed protein product [Effrenium voratum]